MEIPSKYDPTDVEAKWYKEWMEKGLFDSDPDEREPFVVVIPPPNVTGVLHMGHMLNNTLQDVLVRRARMMGKNACWVPGTDHASIATEAKVVAKLSAEGIDKNTISRDEFLEHAWEWKEKHGGIILEQLKRLGASCDWRRTSFTMDEGYYEDVINVFIDLYNKNKIYRGVRMVNWDPEAKTAVSDEEVIYKEVQSKLYYLNYQIKGEDEFVTIATTRPETILGDTAVCINPNDERYSHLKGKKVLVPLIEREIPIIEDEYVDMEFGTGCLKITPAHDINDYEIGIKHNLKSIDIFNDDGTLNESAQLFIGKDRFDVRKEIVKELEKSGNLNKTEDYVNKVGYSERTDAVIEPKLSMQWFLSMKELADPALKSVMEDKIKLHPDKFKNTYRHWMENVKDWCISRQLWWGHRIPVFYINGTNEHVAAKSKEEALKIAIEKTGNKNLTAEKLHQDEDVLDTWFSSWLWPISVFNGMKEPDNDDIKYYYPTNDLVTAPEILFFWVARMIIAGYEYRNDIPFKNVYLTGIVRDKQRRKMSKSLGNSPDPIKLMEKYSADGVRVGMLLCSPAGNDLLFDEALTEQGRNFGNKIWNAFRLIQSWEVADIDQPVASKEAITWFREKLKQELISINRSYEGYRVSEALMSVYRLFWDDFSSWFLEIIKPAYQQPIDKATKDEAILFFKELMKILHPFMPFITEELWQFVKGTNDKYVMVSTMPLANRFNTDIVDSFDHIKEIVTGIRNIRKEKNIPNKESIDVKILPGSGKQSIEFVNSVIKLANIDQFETVKEKEEGAISFRAKSDEVYVLLGDLVDTEDEIRKIKEELEHKNGFLKIVMKKLGNERFVNNAPEKVVEIEKKKKADAEEQIKLLEERLKDLEK